jgi:hypothetical protein
MKVMKNFYRPAILLFGALLLLCPLNSMAQLKALGVGPIKTSKALLEKADLDGKVTELERATQALDSQLTSALTGTRKFKVTARGDLDLVTEEQVLSGGAVAGLDWILIPTVDDFQDVVSTATFAAIGKTVARRTVRLSVVLKLYDTQNGVLLEAPSVLVNRTTVNENAAFAQTDGDETESLLLEVTKQAAAQGTRKILDATFPAKVLLVSGSAITFNRGSGTGVEKDQVWKIHSVGQALVDPDTGEELGKAAQYVGKIRITTVETKFAVGEVIENLGIQKGSVLRME